MVISVAQQPQELVGHEYRDVPTPYRWFEFQHQGVPYAKVAMTIFNKVAFLYWRLVGEPGLPQFRELKRVDMPHMRRLCVSLGAERSIVGTSDPADTHFDKITRLMGYESLTKIAETKLR